VAAPTTSTPVSPADVEPTLLAPAPGTEGLPPILAGHVTGAAQARVEGFYNSIDRIFESWVARRSSAHTQRAYRGDVMGFVRFVGLRWPEEAWRLLIVSIADVQRWRDSMVSENKAPKTMNRRVSSLSSFYKYLAGSAAEIRLPITVPNPAHAQFIARASSDPVEETLALTATRARQLMGLPSGDSLLEFRDRAILKTWLYTGVRIGTVCRLRVKDFLDDPEDPKLRISEKGDKRRSIGIHFTAADALREYLQHAVLESGSLFRARKAPSSEGLAERPISAATVYRVVTRYLRKLPGSVKEDRCIFRPHSLRATTATLLLDAGVDIRKVQELLGHRHVTTTQIYDKRRRTTKESASHDVPI
jgi:site-specific recombinase XerD